MKSHRTEKVEFRAPSEPNALWTVPETGHVGGYQARPQECERHVVGCFDRALAVEPEVPR